jgi:predicted ATPase
MLKSIRISNFKRIDQNGIELEELAPVNYLVGENGCGKSSILEALQYFFIFSPRNTEIEIGTKEICEILDVEDVEASLSRHEHTPHSRPRETILNTTDDTDLHFESGDKMFHPKGRITVCLSQRDLKRSQNQEKNSFTPAIIRCDGIFYLENKYSDLEGFLEINSVLNKSKGSNFVRALDGFLKNRLRTKREINLSELAYLLDHSEPRGDNTPQTQKLLKYLRHLLRSKQVEAEHHSENQANQTENETKGENILSKLALGILYLNQNFGVDLFLLEEPENHLHPRWQKQLAYLFDYLSKEFEIQFVCTTHSPFLISSSSQLTQEAKDRSEVEDFHFDAPQKVYFLKNGSIASKRGEIEYDGGGHLKGRFGYWGSKVNYISSKMLGTGLMDLISPQLALASHDAPEIIFCEGEGGDEDARLYNIIFKDLTPPVLFISSRGATQLLRTFSIIKEIKKGLAANFTIKMLRDRDHEFPSQADIELFQKKNHGVRVLQRRAIECYLFCSETASLWLKKRHKKADPNLLAQMDDLQDQIQKEVERGILGDSYKERLKELFLTIIFGYYPDNFSLDQNFREEISALITPDTQMYRELFEIIWG